ncbi:MAG: replication initiator protein A [Acidobacteriia bacterium]|nr:replication initiator protein A [Terriglobia bacterium]
MPEPRHDTQTILPVVIEEVDLVRVEKSLHSLGFFASTANREISRTIVQILRRPDGQRIQAKAVIEGIPSLGLPTTADRDKYMAFMKFALDQRELQGQLTNPIRFSGAEMIKLLRLRKGGFHYDEINDWCKRMVATTIMSEASIFMADRRQYATDTFHVFDRVVLVGEELNDGTRSEFYQVDLSQWQLTNLNQGYLLPLDFNAYLKLKRDIAKALFGHLSVWFYASRGQSVEKKYPDLCQLLNVRAYPHLSKAREVLEPSLEELTEIGYLSSWEMIRTSRGADFKLMLSPGKRLLSLPNFSSVVNPEARAALEARLPGWVGELVEKGVAERKARQLALDIPDEQAVSDQIEYAEYLIQQDRRGRVKISNPAGFFIWAIENNLCVPVEFETSRKRRLREAQQQADGEHRSRAMQLENQYEEFCQEQIRKELESQYPADRLESALRDQMKAIKREQPEWFGRIPEVTRREVALGRLKSAIRDNLSLPSFEHWTKQNLQQQLF